MSNLPLNPPGAGREHPLFDHSLPVGLMSGENPRYPTQGLAGHDELKHDLETMGVQHEETQGHYGAPERSFIIYGLPRANLVALGKKYGQEAVIHNEGGKREFIYTNGPNEGKSHPGLNTFEHWPEGSEPPEDYYTKLPSNGYVRLHFDFDHVDQTPVHPASPQPAPVAAPPPQAAEGSDGVPMHVAAEAQMTKHEALHALYQKLAPLTKAYVTESQLRAYGEKQPFKHPHAYNWHDGHSDHHYVGHAAGGVLISSKPKLAKHDPTGPVKHPHIDGAVPELNKPAEHRENDQAAGAGVKTYAQFALPFGHIDPQAKANGGTNLFHYDYNGKNDAVNKLVASHGFQPYYAGGKFGKPDLANRNYNTKHLMIYDPTDANASFGDPTYTDSWRKTHELAHALAYPELNSMYGEGRRIGKLGKHRTLNEALRAVHWEHLAAHKQRELNRQLGIEVPDETFNREYNTVMHDAAHRAVTGKFTEPSAEGFVPHSHAVPLETSLGLVREAARNLGLTGMHDLVKKSEGAIAVADMKKTLNAREALHELHKGLTAQVKDWEQKCLELRKAELSKNLGGRMPGADAPSSSAPPPPPPAPPAGGGGGKMTLPGELAKKSPPGRKEEVEKLKAKGLPASEAFGIAWKQHNAETKKDEMPASAGDAGTNMEMSEDEKLDAYAKGELKSNMKCSETPMCKCGDCSRTEKYAKGELKFGKKEVPAGSAPDGVSAFDAKGKVPGDKAPKAVEGEHTKEAGSDGNNIKKAALNTSSPAPAGAAAAGVAGAPKLPKLPGMGKPAMGGMPKAPKLPGMGKPAMGAKPAAPAAPAGGAKPPAMGAGQPALKAENDPSKCGVCGEKHGTDNAKCAALGENVDKKSMKKAGLNPHAVAPAKDVATVQNFAAQQGKNLRPLDTAKQAVKLPGARAAVSNTMDSMLAAPKPAAHPPALKPGATLPASPGVKIPGVGAAPPKPAAAQPMVERVASAMPAGQPGAALTPPPAAARPGAALPGAHLFAKPAPKVK